MISNYDKPNTVSYYESIIDLAALYGISKDVVREQLEYTILTDFILSNTDRHFNNFGFLYHPESRKIIAMAPIFDTGNSLFYNREIIPSKKNLLDISVASFCKKEVEMLRYITNKELVKVERLKGFS